jgi:hypothetical protein
MRSNIQHMEPPPLPASIDDWTRVIKQERSLNDLVEDIHRTLVADPKYRAFLRACWDSQAAEGSLSADNFSAALMIREKAIELDIEEVAREKLATISHALGVVLRRYGASRKQRRNLVGGEIVPNGNGDES